MIQLVIAGTFFQVTLDIMTCMTTPAYKSKKRKRALIPLLVLSFAPYIHPSLGGYDAAVLENKQYMTELQAKAQELEIPATQVAFCPSISDAERARLLQDALCVLYTPDKEHFGIVPLEVCKSLLI